MSHHKHATQSTIPIQWTGVLFALACNMLLVTAADLVIRDQELAVNLAVALRLLAPVVAGLLTALYVRQRGGIHAFIGGMITIPLLALLVFQGNWQSALLAGALCALAGAVSEVLLRKRKTTDDRRQITANNRCLPSSAVVGGALHPLRERYLAVVGRRSSIKINNVWIDWAVGSFDSRLFFWVAFPTPVTV